MNDSDIIGNSIERIESRLTEAFDVEELAQQAFFSKTHYQRLFRAVVGEPVMAYVKNRRLQLACRAVGAGDAGILDIAVKYGYESHEGFARAFKAYFGVTPTGYRKCMISEEREAVGMLADEVLNRIGQRAEKTSAMLGNFIGEAERLADFALETAEQAGAKGATTVMLADELRSLAGRMRRLENEQVRNLAVGRGSAFEMFEKIYAVIRGVDDGVFRMNLLRFFCSVETGRIALPKEAFSAVEAGYVRLCSHFAGNREHMAGFLREAAELLQEDVRREAAKCVEVCAEMADNAVLAGRPAAAAAYAAAESLDGRGRVFFSIAEGVGADIETLKDVAADFRNFRDLPDALSRLENAAYHMGINGFNASVESAREGGAALCLEAAGQIRKYGEVLQAAYRECEDLLSEYGRLTELGGGCGSRCESSLAKKRLEDVIFQSRILSSQFALEAKRINREAFCALARSVTEADAQLARTGDTGKFCEATAQFLSDLNREISALENGGSFACFAAEYEQFLELISEIDVGFSGLTA